MANDTAALVVALSAQLTKFEKDMKDAVGMADKATSDIENKFSRMNPGVGASFLGNLGANFATKAIEGVTEAVKDLITRFLELQKTAEYTGLSMQWVYGLQAAFGEAGASAADVNKGISSIALQLDQMQRGNTTNALATLFAANRNEMKGFNLETANAADALDRVVAIISKIDNQIQKIEIADNLNIPRDLVEGINKYGTSLSKIADDAARGAPDLERIAAQSRAIAEAFKDIGTAIKNWSIEALHHVLELFLQDMANYGQYLAQLFKGGPWESFFENFAYKAAEAADKFNESSKKIESARDRLFVGKKPGGGAVDPFGLGSVGGDTSHAFDRQYEQIEKQTSKLTANAYTVGESAGAQEEYRVQIQLTEAALTQYGEVTDEVRDKIAELSERAGQSKQRLEEQRYALQKINEASATIGQSLATAFADAVVEGKKLSDVMSSLLKSLEKAAINSVFTSLFSAGPGQTASPLAKLFGFAGGTDFAPGGPAIVGEKGPELVNLPRGSQVIPNDVVRASSGGGNQIVYSPAIDARGASAEAVARLAQILEQDRQTFATRTVATIQQARKSRIPGV